MVFVLLGAEPPEPDRVPCRVCGRDDQGCTIFACTRQLTLK